MTASQNPRQAALSEMASDAFLPSSKPEFVMRYPSRVYCGQFSGDGNIFYSCTQDMAVRLYDTSDVHNWKFQKRVTYPNGRWTLTDATLTPNGQYLGVTSITPEVLLANTDPDSDEEHLLDLSNNNAANPLGMDGNAGVLLFFRNWYRQLIGNRYGRSDSLVMDLKSWRERMTKTSTFMTSKGVKR